MPQPLLFSFRPEASQATGRMRFGFWKRGPRLPDVRVDEEGITAPSLTLVGDQFDSAPRTLKWSEVEALRLARSVYGKTSIVFAGPDDSRFLGPLEIHRSDLVDPDGFQRAVESLSGRRFETTFKEARLQESQPVQPSPVSATDEPLAEDIAAGSADSRSFRVITMWGRARGAVLGLAAGGAVVALLYFLAPTAIAAAANFKWVLALLAGISYAFGEFFIAPRLSGYRLVAVRDGLYATVPARRFPRFTAWHELRDFTLTDGKVRSFRLEAGGRRRVKPPRRVTLFTAGGDYFFECDEIESEGDLVSIIQKHRTNKFSR